MTSETMFGICTLRVEVQPEHLLITITTSRALHPSAQRTVISRPRTVASVREALAVTEEFLQSFAMWDDREPRRLPAECRGNRRVRPSDSP